MKKPATSTTRFCLVAERLSSLGGTLNTASNPYNNTVQALVGRQGCMAKVERFNKLLGEGQQDLPQLDAMRYGLGQDRLSLIVETLEEPARCHRGSGADGIGRLTMQNRGKTIKALHGALIVWVNPLPIVVQQTPPINAGSIRHPASAPNATCMSTEYQSMGVEAAYTGPAKRVPVSPNQGACLCHLRYPALGVLAGALLPLVVQSAGPPAVPIAEKQPR